MESADNPLDTVRILDEGADPVLIEFIDSLAESIHLFYISVDDFQQILPVLGENRHPHVSVALGQPDCGRETS